MQVAISTHKSFVYKADAFKHSYTSQELQFEKVVEIAQ